MNCPTWDKACPAEETVLRALSRLREVSPNASWAFHDADLPVSGACSARFSDGERQTSGKGLTRDQSHASAIMEYVERFSWLRFDYRSRPDYFFGTWHDACRRGATPPPEYFLHNYPIIPERDELTEKILRIPLEWIEAKTWPEGKPYLYPINWHNYQYGSNGLCAGNTAPEALVQGASELIERENIYRLFVLREPARRLDPAQVSCEVMRNLLKEADAALQHFYLDEWMRMSQTPWLPPPLPRLSARHLFGANFQQTFLHIMNQRHEIGKKRS